MSDGRRRRYPSWVRVTLIGLQVGGLVAGVVLGAATYDAWSRPDEPEVTTSTTVVVPEAEVPEAPLG